MIAEINLDHIITQDELLEVYRIFCQCYDVKIGATDEKDFLAWQYDALVKEGNFDHRPFMGAKFFGSKHKDTYKFHGYNDCLPEQESYSLQFKEKIKQHFSK